MSRLIWLICFRWMVYLLIGCYEPPDEQAKPHLTSVYEDFPRLSAWEGEWKNKNRFQSVSSGTGFNFFRGGKAYCFETTALSFSQSSSSFSNISCVRAL